ncbi:MAG: copper chaperone PCu(A)C [Hyphomicrobiales bacterium]|nr:copper chaperone PCu(A)C [Hyphomicrobiales bacterium]
MTTFRTIAFACGLTLLGGAAFGHDVKFDTIKVSHPWTRATPKAAPVGAGYMTVVNTGEAPDRLIGASSDSSEKVEIHDMSMDGGIMRMREVEGGLPLKANGRIELKPGGHHLMFIGLKTPFEPGKTVKVTLQFEKAGKLDVDFLVQGAAAPAMDHSTMPHMDHSGMKPMGQ